MSGFALSGLTLSGLEGIVWCYVCVAMRLGPTLVTLPPVSLCGVSWLVRGLLLSMVCLSVTPLIGMQVPVEIPGTLAIGIGVLVCEFLFGASIALSIHLLLAAFETVGNTLADLSGLRVELAPDEAQAGNQVERILVWVAGAIFVLAGGHRWALQLVIETFERFPLGSAMDSMELMYQVPFRFGQALSIAIRLALPSAVVLVAIGMAKAWIARSLSAWDRGGLGGSLQAIGLVWGMLLTLSAMGWIFQHEIADWMDQTQRSVMEPERWSSSSDAGLVGEDG